MYKKLSFFFAFLAFSCFAEIETAYFAGGCFWGIEAFFEYAPSVVKTRTGYMGGTKPNPTYNDVSTGTTGHVEAVEVQYESTRTTYTNLAKLFFEIHDPSYKYPEGSHYRSAIFYCNDAQKEMAQNLLDQLNRKGLSTVTELQPLVSFYPAEDYHQRYYAKRGISPCKCRQKNRHWD